MSSFLFDRIEDDVVYVGEHTCTYREGVKDVCNLLTHPDIVCLLGDNAYQAVSLIEQWAHRTGVRLSENELV